MEISTIKYLVNMPTAKPLLTKDPQPLPLKKKEQRKKLFLLACKPSKLTLGVTIIKKQPNNRCHCLDYPNLTEREASSKEKVWWGVGPVLLENQGIWPESFPLQGSPPSMPRLSRFFAHRTAWRNFWTVSNRPFDSPASYPPLYRSASTFFPGIHHWR